MRSEVIDLRVGSDVWLDGDRWEIVALYGSDAVLRCATRLQRIGLAELAARESVFGVAIDRIDVDPDAVVLSGLTVGQRRQVMQRAAVVAGVLDGAARGSESMQVTIAIAAREAKTSERTIERWISAYRISGVAGLVDARVRRSGSSRIDPRWDVACLRVLAHYVDASTPTRGAVIAEVAYALDDEFGSGVVPLPSKSTAYSRLAELSKGKHSFGSAKARRSVAHRPKGPFGRLRACRPGEYVVLDTTPLDVFAMEPVTLRWVGVELTVAMDLFSRCVLGLRLIPVSTKAADVSNVLYQCVAPSASESAPGDWPFHGVPNTVLLAHEQPRADLPSCVPEAIVVDHGRQYLSAHVVGACARLGIGIQPAIPNKPTDKPTVERFFRTLRESLLQHLPAYKGPDVYSRGKQVEDQAFLYVSELEQIIREWVGGVYHRSKHHGLCVPELPDVALSPAEMFEAGIARAGGLQLLTNPDVTYEFLDVRWRTIQHYGVDVDGLRYDGPALNLYRNTRSAYGGVHAGKWPVFVDAHDVRRTYFQDPVSKTWHALDWEHAAGLDQPFSRDAADYLKRICVRENRHVDPEKAVHDLLVQWSRGEVETRRDRNLARRLSAQRASGDQAEDPAAADAAQEVASLPGVIDLLERREQRAALEVVDDIDVFERYFVEHPDTAGLEVFEE